MVGQSNLLGAASHFYQGHHYHPGPFPPASCAWGGAGYILADLPVKTFTTATEYSPSKKQPPSGGFRKNTTCINWLTSETQPIAPRRSPGIQVSQVAV